MFGGHAAKLGLRHCGQAGRRSLHLPAREQTVVEAAMFWNEPNNLSHWNFQLDPDWSRFAQMVNLASDAVRAEKPGLRRVLGGMSPIDPQFVRNMAERCVLAHVDVVAVHGFP